MERDDELFDFSDQILGESSQTTTHQDIQQSDQIKLTYQNEVHTSYLLVNALFNLLLRKGVIFPHEVNPLVEELHTEYMKRKGRDANGTS